MSVTGGLLNIVQIQLVLVGTQDNVSTHTLRDLRDV
jgi:hypothetical protein